MYSRKLFCILTLVLMSGMSALAWALPARIPVSQTGIYSISFSALGLTESVPVDQLQLKNRGIKVAMTVNDADSDDLFEAGDSIEFYGRPVSNDDPEFKFTEKNIYWLDTDNSPPVRAASWQAASTGTPESFYRDTVHFEENWTYWQAMPNGTGKDHWFWGAAINGNVNDPAEAEYRQRSYSIVLSDIDSTTGSLVNLRVSVQGATDDIASPDHSTRISLNGNLLTSSAGMSWEGQGEMVFAFPVVSSLLVNGPNDITLEELIPPNVVVDSFYVDWIEVDYDRSFVAENDSLLFSYQSSGLVDFSVAGFTANNVLVYDVSDPAQVRRIVAPVTGGVVAFSDFFSPSEMKTYLAVGDTEVIPITSAITFQDQAPTLTVQGKGADYIIITHEDLLGTDIDRLAQHREVDGYQVEVVTTQEIYDTFSGGLFTPVAIKDFLRHAYNNWSPTPQFLVLIGDASLDYKDYFNTEQTLRSQFVPTYAVETTGIGETPSDNWLVTLDQDALPDIYVGRIPAKSSGDIRIAVDKIISYETGASGTWQSRFLMTSGDDDPRFVEQTDNWLAKYIIPPGYRPLRISVADYSNRFEAKGKFSELINGEGVLVSAYFGHGGVDGWLASRTAGFEILTSDDVTNTLTNDRALPFFVAFNCLNGLFAQPSEGLTFPLPDGSGNSFIYDVPLSEALLFQPDGGGAIAMWSPNALAYPTEQEFIGDNLFSLMIDQGVTRLGEATTRAKVQAVVDGKANAENLDIFTLIGDPATRLALGTASVGGGGGGGGGGGVLSLSSLFLLFLWGATVVRRRIQKT